jgi:serine O-acetyltransferase
MSNRLLTGSNIDVDAEVSASAIIPHTICLVIGAMAIVEDAVILMPHVVLGALDTTTQGRRHPHVQEGAMVGAGAKLLGPITVGKGARTGVNSVVFTDVPAGATVIGIPGKII